MNLHLIDIYHDLEKVAVPKLGKEELFAKFLDDLHQAALRELDYQAAVRRLEAEDATAHIDHEEHQEDNYGLL